MSLPDPPPCPPWCVSDHDAEDTVTETLVHRPHFSLPWMIKNTRQVVLVVTRTDMLTTPTPEAGRWGEGTPQVRVSVNGCWLVLRSPQDVTTTCLLLDEGTTWGDEQITRLSDAAAHAWPEWATQEAFYVLKRRLRREGAIDG